MANTTPAPGDLKARLQQSFRATGLVTYGDSEDLAELAMKVIGDTALSALPAASEAVGEVGKGWSGPSRAVQWFGLAPTPGTKLYTTPAPVAASGEAWESPFGPCVCNGANECPGCNPNAAIELARQIATADERRKHAPCLDCGATSAEEAQGKCHCSGDKDDCHGCQLWPDDTTPPPTAVSDDELPGMWSHADFTGGDPDERSYAERTQSTAPAAVGAQGDGTHFVDGLGWVVPCSQARSYVASIQASPAAGRGDGE